MLGLKLNHVSKRGHWYHKNIPITKTHKLMIHYGQVVPYDNKPLQINPDLWLFGLVGTKLTFTQNTIMLDMTEIHLIISAEKMSALLCRPWYYRHMILTCEFITCEFVFDISRTCFSQCYRWVNIIDYFTHGGTSVNIQVLSCRQTATVSKFIVLCVDDVLNHET